MLAIARPRGPLPPQNIIFDGMGKRNALWVLGIAALTLVNVDFRRCGGQGLNDDRARALYASSTPTTIVGGTFSGNVGQKGSALYVDDWYHASTPRVALHVSGTTFSGNEARDLLASARGGRGVGQGVGL